ncbi:hypothetical protein ACFL4L_04030 [bacterium]
MNSEIQYSISIEIVWNMAAQEAIVSDFEEIQPEHFLVALLKMAETDNSDIAQAIENDLVAKQLSSEIQTLNTDIDKRQINSTKIRRQIREKLGKGNSPYKGGQLHRAQTSRDIFDTMARQSLDSGQPVLMLSDLFMAILNNPSPVIVKVLGKTVVSEKKQLIDMPLLREYGIDLTSLAQSEEIKTDKSCDIEARSLIDILKEKEYQSIFFVCDDLERAASIIKSAVCKMTSIQEMMTKHVVDLSDNFSKIIKNKEVSDIFRTLLHESAEVKKLIMIIPHVGNDQPELRDAYLDILNHLDQYETQIICLISTTDYEPLISKHALLKKKLKSIFIRKEQITQIPSQI